MKRPKKRTPAKMPSNVRRFERRAAAPFKEVDTDLVGTELMKLAAEFGVDEIDSLDPEQTYERIRSDPKHPLRRFYDFDDVEKAARAHWIDFTKRLLNSVSYITVDMKKTDDPIPLFVYGVAPIRKDDGTSSIAKRRMVSNQMLKNDAAFISSVGEKIRIVRAAVSGLEWVIRTKKSAVPLVAELHEKLERALTEYDDALVEPIAAE